MTPLKLNINKRHRFSNRIVVASTYLINLITVIAYPELAQSQLLIVGSIIFSISCLLAFFVKQSVPNYVTVDTQEIGVYYSFGKKVSIPIKDIFYHKKEPMGISNVIYTTEKKFTIHSFDNDEKILEEVCATNNSSFVSQPFNKLFKNNIQYFPHIAAMLFFWGVGAYQLKIGGTYYGFLFLGGAVSTIISFVKIASFKGFILHLTNESLTVDHKGRTVYAWKDISDVRITYGEHHSISHCQIGLNSGATIEVPVTVKDLYYMKTIVGACVARVRYS